MALDTPKLAAVGNYQLLAGGGSGSGPTLLPVTQSLDFSGSNQAAIETTPQLMSLVNAWTLAVWVKFDVTTSGQRIQLIGQVGSANSFELQTTSSTGARFRAVLDDSAGTQQQDYIAGFTYAINTWYHLVLTWDGTSYALYNGGALDTPFLHSPNNPGTQTDTTRTAYVAVNSNTTTGFMNGKHFTAAMWNRVLSAAEISDLATNALADYRVDFGNYSGAANLMHYHVWGLNTGTINAVLQDYGSAPTAALQYSAFGITTGNLIADVPP